MVQLVSLVRWVIQDNREIKVYKVLRDQQDSRVLMVTRVLRERLAGPGLLVRLAYKALQVLLEQLDSKGLQDNKGPWVQQVAPDWLDRLDNKVPRV